MNGVFTERKTPMRKLSLNKTTIRCITGTASPYISVRPITCTCDSHAPYCLVA